MPGSTSTPTPAPGLGVDARGNAVIDPTANVISLVEAGQTRQDDLRAAQNALTAEKVRHVEAMAQLRAEHSREIRQSETDRLDKIRQVDVLAVSTAADRAQAAIQALAAVTTTNAENLRNALTATATTLATQLATTVAAINERIATLEKSSYTGQGKSTVADPQLAELVLAVNKLMAAGSVGVGKAEGLGLGASILIGAVGLLSTLLGIAGVLYAVLKR